MCDLLRISVVLLCAFLLVGVRVARCDDADVQGPVEDELDTAIKIDEEQVKDGKPLASGSRRSAPAPAASAASNATRDSQLLSVLAARRRQLLNGRLATHISTLASLANKNKSNATFAQLEVRDSTNSVVKKLTFENSSNDAIAPSLKITTTRDGNKEIKQDVKPHEVRHLFVPRVYHDSRTRAGFINNRRRNSSQDNATESNGAIYVPPDKLEGLDKELVLDPEEEFQVDESNHGLYLLNYSDTDNVTRTLEVNKTVSSNETKETTTMKPELTPIVILEPENVTEPVNETKDVVDNVTISSNKTEESTTLVKVESDKDKVNNTLFMSDELYNHFNPLESELPDEDMAPFIYFGQKLGGPAINDNLTNSPSLSTSTKSANFINTEKRKYNSRYSATEKYKNSSVGEDEVNEDMDVSVVKNIIENNKVRNTVKGPAPARQVGLVNAYRKSSTATATSKAPSAAELNTTEPIVSVTPGTVDKTKDSNRTANITTEQINKNTTVLNNDSRANSTNTPRTGAVTSTTLKPYTRNYHNLRRRPARVTVSPELTPSINSTTEKASTLVYTAVVTSVSITSSVRGQNKTDLGKDSDNSTTADTNLQIEALKPILINETEPTPAPVSSTHKPYRHRIRIRTTSTESPVNKNPSINKATDSPVASELSTKNTGDLKTDASSSRLPERLANLYRINEDTNSSTVRPKNILRRRRPTTSTSTTPEPVTKVYSPRFYTHYDTNPTLEPIPTTTLRTEASDVTENTFAPFIVTSRTSSESSSKPFFVPANSSLLTSHTNTTFVNKSQENSTDSRNEEVLIEAEKTYTASYVLAGLGFLPVAAIVAFVLRNLLNKKTKEIDTEYEGYFDDNDVKKESPITPVARPAIPTPTKPDEKWEFPRNKLRLQTVLGQGNFGLVWKAEADDLSGHNGLTRLVAVKSIKESATQKEKQELLHEIYIMQKIGTHPNVVTLLGCCTQQEPYLLIMEYVMRGKLLTYLRERRARPAPAAAGAGGGGGGAGLAARDLTVFAYCCARGMDYIASKGIIHRDLAARNILVDHNKLCKIADFGMSRDAGPPPRAAARHAHVPVRWMAPEALLYGAYTHQTDVWALGILLWEIVTLGSTPYAAMSGREAAAAVCAGYRLERPAHCAPALYRAALACWHHDPLQRPSFAQLKQQLADLLHNEPAEGNYVDLDSFYQDSSVYSDPSAIIHDEEGLSAEYDRERRCFRDLSSGGSKYPERRDPFSLGESSSVTEQRGEARGEARGERGEARSDTRGTFSLGGGGQRMGGFGIRDMPFDRNFSDSDFENTFKDRSFNEKSFSDRDRQFSDKSFNERPFDVNFNDRKDGKLSTSSFHRERERERENPLVSRNSFSGFPRIGNRDSHFQLISESRNKRVPEFECDI